MSDTEEPATAHRRSQLKLWIDLHFGGSQKLFIASTNDGDKQINQGELSGLLRSKSFGEKRARSLEKLAKMPVGYLDAQIDLPTTAHSEPSTGALPWPFARVTAERLSALKRSLGPLKGAQAIEDIEDILELAVMKWERRVAADKNAAA